jgi:hypothetical protein
MRRKILPILVARVILLSVGLSSCNPVAIPDGVGGILSSDTTWTLNQSPIRLTSKLIVPAGITLTIESGVYVDLYQYQIEVNGILNASGTNNHRIIISTSLNKNSGLFANNPLPEALHLNSGSGGSTILYATITERVVIADSIVVSKSRFEDFIGIDRGSPTISDSYISYMSIFNGSSQFTNNTIDKLFTVEGTPIFKGNVINTLTAHSGRFENNTLTKYTYVSVPVPPHKPGYPIFSGNLISGRASVSADCLFSDNTFTDGISVSNGTATITNNNFLATQNNTIIGVSGNGATITNNRIVGINSSPFNISKHELAPQQIGLYVDSDTNATISNNEIRNCQIGINVLPSYAQIMANVISDNYCGINLAPAQYFSTPYFTPPEYAGAAIIKENEISNNTVGIDIWTFHKAPNITRNTLQENSLYNLRLRCSNETDAAYNWWGTNNPDTISQSIYDGKDDPALGTVTFSPFYTASNQSVSTVSTSQILQISNDSTPFLAVAIGALVITVCTAAVILAKHSTKDKK